MSVSGLNPVWRTEQSAPVRASPAGEYAAAGTSASAAREQILRVFTPSG